MCKHIKRQISAFRIKSRNHNLYLLEESNSVVALSPPSAGEHCLLCNIFLHIKDSYGVNAIVTSMATAACSSKEPLF